MGTLTAVLRKKNGDFLTNSRGESVVYIRYSNKSKEVFFSTGVSCFPKAFDSKNGTINSLKGNIKGRTDAEKSTALKKQDSVSNKKISRMKSQIQEIINDLEYSDTEASTENVKLQFKSGISTNPTFWQKFAEYDEFRKANDKKNTYKQVPALKKSLLDFEKSIGRKLDFDTIDLPLLKKYTTYLTTIKKHSPNYVGYFIKALKTFLNTCISEGFELKFSLKDLKKPVELKSIIFLTEDEIKQLYSFSYKFARHRKVVDLFTLQCYTGFRVSDFKRLNPNNIKNGEIFIHRSMKTDRPMQVPLIGLSEVILEKYDFVVPSIAEQNYNKYIKEAAEIAIPNSKIEVTKLIKGEKRIRIEEKHRLLTSHVAVKTFVNMAYSKGVSVEAIAKITGKSEAVIRKHYLQFSISDASDELKLAFT